jgi:hypothetical protein
MWDTVQYCIFALAEKEDYVKNPRNGGKRGGRFWLSSSEEISRK